MPRFLAGFFVLALGCLVFVAGLSGPFLHDDIANLSGLAFVQDFSTFNEYVSSGDSGPLGRPVSLITFGLQADSWPDFPGAFKFVNLLIHLLMGCLIGLFYYQVSRLAHCSWAKTMPVSSTKPIFSGAILLALLWVIHPMHISTVLYPVQRMAQLSSLFMLCGVLVHVYLRLKVVADVKGYALLSGNLLIFGTLAILSKENGILLPVYLLVVEAVLLGQHPFSSHRNGKIWKGIFLWGGLLVILVYLAYLARDPFSVSIVRGFSVYERVLTESRILVHYLVQICLPFQVPSTLFHDDFVISRGFLNPLTTLFSALGIILSIGLAVIYRAKAPVAAFAILWFFVGHILESTVVLLELVYFHRNYLPMIGPLFALVYYAERWVSSQQSNRGKILAGSGVFLLLTTMAFQTATEARNWGSSLGIAESWLRQRPDSVKTLRYATAAITHADPAYAADLLRQAQRIDGLDLGVILQQILLSCHVDESADEEFLEAARIVEDANFDGGIFVAIQNLQRLAVEETCSGVTSVRVIRLLDGMLKNPRYYHPVLRYNANYIMAEAFIDLLDLNGAMLALTRASKWLDKAEIPMRQAEILASAGLLDQARMYLLKVGDDRDLLQRKLALQRILSGVAKDR